MTKNYKKKRAFSASEGWFSSRLIERGSVMEEGLGQNSVPPHGPIDKSKILDIKPLRSLIPISSANSNWGDDKGCCHTCSIKGI